MNLEVSRSNGGEGEGSGNLPFSFPDWGGRCMVHSLSVYLEVPLHVYSPITTYYYPWYCYSLVTTSCYHYLLLHHRTWRLGFVSCNNYLYFDDTMLWERLVKERKVDDHWPLRLLLLLVLVLIISLWHCDQSSRFEPFPRFHGSICKSFIMAPTSQHFFCPCLFSIINRAPLIPPLSILWWLSDWWGSPSKGGRHVKEVWG